MRYRKSFGFKFSLKRKEFSYNIKITSKLKIDTEKYRDLKCTKQNDTNFDTKWLVGILIGILGIIISIYK